MTALLTVALLVSVVPSAFAVPSKQQQAEAVKKEIETLDHELEVASERYNESRERHQAIVVKRDEAAAQVADAEVRMAELRDDLSVRAKSMYRSGPLSFLEVLLGAQSFEDFATIWDTLNQLNKSDVELVGELKEAREQYLEAKAELDVQEQAAAAELATMESQKDAVESKLADRQSTLDGLEAEIASELAAIRAREAAAAAAKVWKPAANANIPTPTNRPRSEVVSIAKQYLGVPYVWAGMSPSGFDCSGFTSYVYRQVGVYLPHSSRAQIGYGQRVGASDLQPGDLVFFGSPIHHVGIYIGGGQYIHAPTTGDVVKISNLGAAKNYVGACRP